MILAALVIALLTGMSAHAQSNSTDFSRSDDAIKIIDNAEFRDRFELVGEIFITDLDGNLLSSRGEIRKWKFGKKGNLMSNWNYEGAGHDSFALRQTWTLSDKNALALHIQQFDSMKKDGPEIVTGKLLREEKISLRDFGAITWQAAADKKQRVVVRLTPRMTEQEKLLEGTAMPISLHSPVVYDNKGGLWVRATGNTLEAQFVSLKTHKGQISVSYTPFRGSREIGYVEGSDMVLAVDGDQKVYVRSESPISGSNKKIKIYGVVDLSRKSDGFNSVYAYASNREKEFLAEIY